MKPLLICLALLLAPLAAPAAELDTEQQARFQALSNELRCLVCQNQSIAESDAPLANDLREQVRAQLAAGKSDAQIKRYLTDRYGDFVLYRPPLKPATWLLWAGPFALLLLALLVAWRVSRARRAAPTTAADPAALQRLLDEQGDDAREDKDKDRK